VNFSQRLKKLRKERDITQEDLAKTLNYGRTAIAGYESGRNQPDYNILTKLADYFDVSADYLLGRTDERNNNMNKIMKPNPKFFEWLKIQHLSIQEDYWKRNEVDKAHIRNKSPFSDIEEEFINKAIEKVKTTTSNNAAIIDRMLSPDVDLEKVKAGLDAGLFKK